MAASALSVENYAIVGGLTTFTAVGKPAMIRIKGESTKTEGNLKVQAEELTGTLKLSLATLTTGIETRDNHMKEKYLQVDKYPDAVLKLNSIHLPGSSEKEFEIPFTGSLVMHGKEKGISGSARLHKTPSSISGSATFTVELADFTIETPSYAGIKVSDHVDITAQFTAVER